MLKEEIEDDKLHVIVAVSNGMKLLVNFAFSSSALAREYLEEKTTILPITAIIRPLETISFNLMGIPSEEIKKLQQPTNGSPWGLCEDSQD